MAVPDVIHLGAENCVTGSCHLLQWNGLNIMVDCGAVQGRDQAVPVNEWPVKPSNVDFLFITHAHIDHTGRIPELITGGFHGDIICSHPTRALLPVMLMDAMHFMDIKGTEYQKILKNIDELSWGFEYDQEFDLKNGVTFSLGRAGHILGSSFIRFRSEKGGEEYSVQFSGDLGNFDTPILPDPDTPWPCDLLVLESTYGDRLHEGRGERLDALGKALTSALEQGGKVYIPAFALGRTQELLFELDRLFTEEEWSDRFPLLATRGRGRAPVPVFLDTPLGTKITESFSSMAKFWDREAKDLLRSGDQPFDFEGLYSVLRYADHVKVLEYDRPAIIIAGSGMCTGGRIVEHLREGLKMPENHVLFVGYQASGTPGRDILKYSRRPGGYVVLQGERVPIKAQVTLLSGYSAHADSRGLVRWVSSMPEKPGRIKLVHGDPHAQSALRDKLSEEGYVAEI